MLNKASHPVIKLRKVKHRNLQNLLNFMYQGEENVNEENFLEIAEDFNVRGPCERNTEGFKYFTSQTFIFKGRKY